MRRNEARAIAGIMLSALSLPALGAVVLGQSEPTKPPSAGDTIACRALETHAVESLGVTLVVFHQRDEAARASLGELLRERPGTSVEFQTRDAQWHAATVLRLKSCFGRGLLVFATANARLAEKEEFLLRVRERG